MNMDWDINISYELSYCVSSSLSSVMETFASLYCFVTSISPSEESWEKFLAASIRLVRLAFLTFCHKYQFRIPLHAKNKPFLLHWHDIGWNAIRIIRCIHACHVLECKGWYIRSFPKFSGHHNQIWVFTFFSSSSNSQSKPSRSKLTMLTMFNLVQTCSIMFHHVLSCSYSSWLFHTCPDLSRLVQTCPVWSRYDYSSVGNFATGPLDGFSILLYTMLLTLKCKLCFDFNKIRITTWWVTL